MSEERDAEIRRKESFLQRVYHEGLKGIDSDFNACCYREACRANAAAIKERGAEIARLREDLGGLVFGKAR
jgi:hypothetical protein